MRRIKLFAALLAVMLCVCSAYADDVKIGIITKAGITEEEFTASVPGVWKWAVLEDYHADKGNRYYFYDSINSLLMAIRRGDIDEIQAPRTVAEYFVKMNPEYRISCVLGATEADSVFGFLRGLKGFELRERFNDAIRALQGKGILQDLQQDYIINPKYDVVPFDKFEGAETVKVAVTGDMPPIDYVDAEGNAAGFNTALLAALGREMKVNIELVDVDSIARTPALTSERVDAVFWYQVVPGLQVQHDIPEEVIVSMPYFAWDTFVHITKAEAEK